MALTVYGDISPSTAAAANVVMLKRGEPHLVLQPLGQAKPLAKNQGSVQTFRRYERLTAATTAITEGVTPTGSTPTVTPYQAALAQYGDYLELTDVIADIHTDPVLQEYSGMIGEQAALTVETVLFNILKAGTNLFRANGAARTDINTPYTLNLQRKAVRSLQRQLARPYTTKVSSTPNFNTENVAGGFVAAIHPDLIPTIRGLQGFQDARDYKATWNSELGAVEDVRYVVSTIIEPWADGGGAKAGSGTTMESTTGTAADVYPVLIFAPDAFGVVPLKGANAMTPIVLNPNVPRGGDPLAQRGSVGWKTYFTAKIINESWMCRVECAVPAI